jgi:hypothetical protein
MLLTVHLTGTMMQTINVGQWLTMVLAKKYVKLPVHTNGRQDDTFMTLIRMIGTLTLNLKSKV